MDPRPEDGPGWARPALRSVALMVLVMGSIVGAGVGALALWGAGHPTYVDAVLAPAQEGLARDRDAIQAAQAAALGGNYAGARAILEQVRDGQGAFARAVLLSAPPPPALEGIHAALLGLYATLGEGLAAAIRCLDELAAGRGLAAAPVCATGQAALAQVPQQAQDIADRLADLRRALAS